MIDQNFPFLRPYVIVATMDLQRKEVISYPYQWVRDGLTYVEVRDKGVPETMEIVLANSLLPANWHDYAKMHKQCFVKPSKFEGQSGLNVYLPTDSAVAYCDDIEKAREVAARYGCTIIL